MEILRAVKIDFNPLTIETQLTVPKQGREERKVNP